MRRVAPAAEAVRQAPEGQHLDTLPLRGRVGVGAVGAGALLTPGALPQTPSRRGGFLRVKRGAGY